jgi:hypothetical protein
MTLFPRAPNLSRCLVPGLEVTHCKCSKRFQEPLFPRMQSVCWLLWLLEVYPILWRSHT